MRPSAEDVGSKSVVLSLAGVFDAVLDARGEGVKLKEGLRRSAVVRTRRVVRNVSASSFSWSGGGGSFLTLFD